MEMLIDCLALAFGQPTNTATGYCAIDFIRDQINVQYRNENIYYTHCIILFHILYSICILCKCILKHPFYSRPL